MHKKKGKGRSRIHVKKKGKSTLVSAIHTHARQYGYLASSKFDSAQKRPYHGLLRCLSSVLRQLLTESEAVIHDFYQELKEQLGPHFSNVHLMVGMVPELKPILSDHDWNNVEDDDMIPNINTESRFHAVRLRLRTGAQPIDFLTFLSLCVCLSLGLSERHSHDHTQEANHAGQ